VSCCVHIIVALCGLCRDAASDCASPVGSLEWCRRGRYAHVCDVGVEATWTACEAAATASACVAV
jgi:hypothetical protein